MVDHEVEKYCVVREHRETTMSSNRDPVKSGDNKVKNSGKICTTIVIHRGKLLVLISSCIFALWSTLARILTVTMHPIQVVVMTTPFATVGSAALCVYQGIKPPKGLKCYLLLLASGTLIVVKNIAHFWSLIFILLADAVTISQLQVVMIGLLSCIVLREKPSAFDAVFGIVAILGVAVIARPTFIFGQNQDPPLNYNPVLGILLSLLNVVTAAGFIIISRKLSIVGVHPYFISFFNTAVSSVISTVICTALGYWTCPASHELLLSSAIGTLYFMGQVMIYVGLVLENATTVSILFTFKIVAGFICQFIVFLLLPPWTSVCGAALVMFACIGTIWQSSKKTQGEQIVADNALEEEGSPIPGDESLEAVTAKNLVETSL